jgi:hypothetical protein
MVQRQVVNDFLFDVTKAVLALTLKVLADRTAEALFDRVI